jgi:imidazolonepropionase-like amidohydrolase
MLKPLRNFFVLISLLIAHSSQLFSQETTFHANGPDDFREGLYAFTHVTLYRDYKTKIENATLVIKNGKIVEAGTGVVVPEGAIIRDLKGRYIYPSFIDIYSDYGVPSPGRLRQEAPQYETNIKGAYNWNQAIKADFEAYKNFQVNNDRADELRKQGFGAVLAHRKDGIARGTGTVVTLATDKENNVVLKGNASAHYSFNKGSSSQAYPESLMGAIALLRQTHLDAQWYKSLTDKREYNITLEAWNNTQALPQIFDAGSWLNALRADKVGDEFGVQYIIKGDGTEYRRTKEIKETKARFIIPLVFPKAYDVEDPYKALLIGLDDMKHWELAPMNAATLSKEGIEFAITTSDLEKKEDFLKNLRIAVKYGLKEEEALKSITWNPAQFINMQDMIGSLDKGKVANFIITTKPLFDDKCIINENWIQGKKYEINKNPGDIRGQYKLTIVKAGNTDSLTLNVIGDIASPRAQLTTLSGYKVQLEINNRDTLPHTDSTKTASRAGFVSDSSKADGKLTYKDNDVILSFDPHKKGVTGKITLTGFIDPINKNWRGKGQYPDGDWLDWTATFVKEFPDTSKPAKKDTIDFKSLTKVSYPFIGYGNEEIPQAANVIIKNATVWTNEKDGILKNADVVIKGGKIAAVGTNLNCTDCQTIDGTDKNLTSGIIDEHNHIAISEGVNEGTEASSAEVRIGDVINSEDINIYRQLSGGVTAAQLLHGSANPIGGQSGLVKFRWGYTPEKMKIEGAEGFIKFALGENVKQSNWGDKYTVRYPQTRMGVEQVYMNEFTRAREYEKALKEKKNVRRNLELDALVEILNKKRFITCHSYVQSEINMLMSVADSFGFRINTFTHILEGYKVADKMKAHGANGSTFADWWAYKYEVIDAIPYNASIMTKVGINTAINSDDAEMARRLNQEAAKSVKYGGMAEEDAWKMVTLNPAKMLHLDSHMGSLKAGKDADIVIWSGNPLSIYAVVEKTYVDGICFYDKTKDTAKREYIKYERARIVQKMLDEKKAGAPTQEAPKKSSNLYNCGGSD